MNHIFQDIIAHPKNIRYSLTGFSEKRTDAQTTLAIRKNMARNVKCGDELYVPCSKFPELDNYPTAFYKSKVVEIEKKSIRVNLPGQAVSPPFGMSLAHKNLGVLILNIGDFETEGPLLNPLSKSILQYARLLMPDDALRYVNLRSLAELKMFWHRDHKAYSHIVLIGHGSKNGIKFGVDGWVSAEQLNSEVIRIWGGDKKTIISLCCQTGYASFGRQVSSFPQCEYFIGPYHSIHGAVASQFCQTFLAHHLLEGRTVVVAFKKAKESVPGSSSFKLWENGQRKNNNGKTNPSALTSLRVSVETDEQDEAAHL